jgi:RNA-directed DNA polymerase
VLDRFVQQAVLQVLQPSWDPTFSDASFGFRPGRSAHQAVARAQADIAEGCACVVDLDLEKCFDRVDQDLLMGLVAVGPCLPIGQDATPPASRGPTVGDRRLLRLIRGFLSAGVLAEGLVGPTDQGVPQGGRLSPLLSNLMLDVLDQELARRGHRFVRYADDRTIHVRSRRAGERVTVGVIRFVTTRLKLRVNATKSAVDQPSRRRPWPGASSGSGS